MQKEKEEKKKLLELKQQKINKQNVGHYIPNKVKDRTLEKKLKTLATKGGLHFYFSNFFYSLNFTSGETL